LLDVAAVGIGSGDALQPVLWGCLDDLPARKVLAARGQDRTLVSSPRIFGVGVIVLLRFIWTPALRLRPSAAATWSAVVRSVRLLP
jgi:hypothetical protein